MKRKNYLTSKNISNIEFIFANLFYYINYYIRNIFSIVKTTENWWDIILFRINIKKNLLIKFRSGSVKKFNNMKQYFDFWNTLEGQKELFGIPLKIKNRIKLNKNFIMFKYKKHRLKFYFDYLRGLNESLILINQQFVEEQYKDLDVKNKIVIDIGATIGDTAIYFALNGAKHVYAFEPYPYSYKIALKNIKANNLEDKITLLNEGVDSNKKNIKIAPYFKNFAASDIKESKRGKLVKITTLEDILERFNINSATLKMDCEGYEYNIILNSNNITLKKIENFIIEYHYGYKNLENKFREYGFKVKHTLPHKVYNPPTKDPNMIEGLLKNF